MTTAEQQQQVVSMHAQQPSSSAVYALATSRYIMLSSYSSCSSTAAHTYKQQTVIGRAGEYMVWCNRQQRQKQVVRSITCTCMPSI